MNKKNVDEKLDKAYDAIKNVNISTDGKTIIKTYRGLVSSFGAAAAMGSVKEAVCFYSDKGGSSVDRTNILKAIAEILGIKRKDNNKIDDCGLLEYCKNNGKTAEREIMEAAVALKLAMNLYELVDSKEGNS